MRVILLGPQRRPTLDAAVRLLEADGPIATITAGWQEREPDDRLLGTLLGGHDVNLGLFRRWLDVLDRDPEYAAGSRLLAGVLGELEDTYLLRLDYALQAVYALQHRAGSRRRTRFLRRRFLTRSPRSASSTRGTCSRSDPRAASSSRS